MIFLKRFHQLYWGHWVSARQYGVELFAGEVGLISFPAGLLTCVADRVGGVDHPPSERDGTLVFNCGKPSHDSVRQARRAYGNLPHGRGVAVWAPDDCFGWAAAAERAGSRAIRSDLFPLARAGFVDCCKRARKVPGLLAIGRAVVLWEGLPDS
jgi:hypothetical protein